MYVNGKIMVYCVYMIGFLDIESNFMPLLLDAEGINYGYSWQWRFTLRKCP